MQTKATGFSIAKLSGVLAVAALTLTACTPPMPPEVKAAMLEQTHICVNGDTNVGVGESMTDALSMISGSVTTSCTGMNILQAQPGQGSPIEIAAGNSVANCKATATVPYAFDAGVLVVSLSAAGSVALTPKTIGKIFDGSITSWDDAAITNDNSGTILPTEPIIVEPISDTYAVTAFSNWYKQLTGKVLNTSKLQPTRNVSVAQLGTLPEGSISLLPYSTFTNYAVTAMTIPLPVGVVLDAVNNPGGVLPDINGISSAGTQFSYSKTSSKISVKLNTSTKPIPPLGSDIAPEPYEASYLVNLNLCGNASKATRAAAVYLLRQDSQGSLTALVPLTETLRAQSLDIVSQGLPQPKITPPAN